MMEYVYREYESRHLLQVWSNTFLGYEDPLQRQPQKKSTWFDILVWMNYLYHEVDQAYMFTLFVRISKVHVKLNIGSDSY